MGTLTKEWRVLLFWQHYAGCELLVNHKSVSLTEMCLISSCCCGFQELDHGLLIFAIFNILINFLMVGVGMYTGGGGKLLAFLILVDVALAVGAKLRVRLLILAWLILYGIHILLSVIAPPIVLALGFATNHLMISGGSHFRYLRHFFAGDARHGQILLMVHHAITFVLGLLYVYFWMMARSLFLMLGRVGSEKEREENKIFTVRGQVTPPQAGVKPIFSVTRKFDPR